MPAERTDSADTGDTTDTSATSAGGDTGDTGDTVIDTGADDATKRARAAVAALESAPQEPGGKKPDAILSADKVVRTFGGLKAVDVDHVEIQRGSITALIGPNGAGKTTFFNLLTGFDKPNQGSWQFNGNSLSGVAPYRVARQGMVRTFQLTKALSRLTVLENVRLGAPKQRGERLFTSILPWLWREQEKQITDQADTLLERFNLVRVRDDFAGSLSGGQRKLLEMARALMVGPEMVMLDEPMAGVNPRLRQTLNDHIRGLREEGATVLFVEHDMDVVRDVSDWVIVMAQGQIVAEGPPDAVMANPAVIDAYLGAHHDGALSVEDEEEQLRAAEEQIDEEEQAR